MRGKRKETYFGLKKFSETSFDVSVTISGEGGVGCVSSSRRGESRHKWT